MRISKLTVISLSSIILLVVLFSLSYFFRAYQAISEFLFLSYIYLGFIFFPIMVIAFIKGIIKKSFKDIVFTSVILLFGVLQVFFSLLVVVLSYLVD